MRLSKFFIITILVLLLSTSAAAGFEGTDTVTYIPIEGNSFAVDELDGVPALYNAYDSYYQCSEYVQRYYSQVYGIEMDFSGSGPQVKTEGFLLEQTDAEPRTGDIAYIPAYNRGKSYGHWAIVKEYSNGTVTLIEQNWRWSNMAAYERKISWPSGSYIFYRLTDGEDYSFPSCWAKDSVYRCIELGIGNDLQDNYRRSVTRLEFCGLLMETISCIDPTIHGNDELFFFDDTVSSTVSEAVSLGIVAQNSTFRPNDAITRQEAAMMMDSAISVLDLAYPNADAGICPIDDTVSDWASEAVENMLSIYFFVNDENGSFMADNEMEIQHAYVLMMYLYDYAQKTAYGQHVTAGDIASAISYFYAWEEFFKNNG